MSGWCSARGFRTRGRTRNLYELYQKVAAGTEPKSKLAGLLRDSIKLYQDTGNGPPLRCGITRMTRDNWTIAITENVVIKQEDGKTVVCSRVRAEVPMPPSTPERCDILL